MDKFAKNAAIVITFLKENHYSEQTVHNYEKIYNSAQAYLNQKGVIYSPETGEQMLDQQEIPSSASRGLLSGLPAFGK